MIDIEEIKDRLIARYAAEDIIELLQPDVEVVVESLHEFLILNYDEVLKIVDYDDEVL